MLAPLANWQALLCCVVLGGALASIGFSVMHDANHGSYSTHPKLNDFLGLSLNAMGASSYFWKQKHNIIHHTYTNVDGIDDDIAKSPIIRHCESQKWVPAHKVQYLYLLPVYSLSTIFWIYIMDFTKYFSRKIILFFGQPKLCTLLFILYFPLWFGVLVPGCWAILF